MTTLCGHTFCLLCWDQLCDTILTAPRTHTHGRPRLPCPLCRTALPFPVHFARFIPLPDDLAMDQEPSDPRLHHPGGDTPSPTIRDLPSLLLRAQLEDDTLPDDAMPSLQEPATATSPIPAPSPYVPDRKSVV